jgi:hypothetical protein
VLPTQRDEGVHWRQPVTTPLNNSLLGVTEISGRQQGIRMASRNKALSAAWLMCGTLRCSAASMATTSYSFVWYRCENSAQPLNQQTQATLV